MTKRWPRQVIREVAEAHGLSIEDLVGPSRKHAHIRARWEAMRRIKEEFDLSLPRIGRFFNKDHTTVLNALRGGASKRDWYVKKKEAAAARAAAAPLERQFILEGNYDRAEQQ